MNNDLEKRLKQIFKLCEERNQFLDGWLRWLILISSGCLSVIIPLSKKENMSGIEHVLFSLTCISIGISIILLSIRIYSILDEKKKIIKGLAQSMREHSSHPVFVEPPKWMLKCEHCGYVTLIIGIVLFISFACFN